LKQFKVTFEGLQLQKKIYFQLKILTLKAQNFEKNTAYFTLFFEQKNFFHDSCKKLKLSLLVISVVSQIAKILFANTPSAFPSNLGRDQAHHHTLIFHQNFYFGDSKF
jgi:hypothetical protein